MFDCLWAIAISFKAQLIMVQLSLLPINQKPDRIVQAVNSHALNMIRLERGVYVQQTVRVYACVRVIFFLGRQKRKE